MATKMATKEAVVSKTESLVLMKNMMRISISSICYVRDLFPRDCFKNKPYGNVDIHQLQGAKKKDNGEIMVTHPDAFLLTQWLEQGVFHALELEYLSSVVFAIFSKHPVTQDDLLLETYEFKVSYQAEGAAKINEVALVSKESVKNQAAKFIRSLTEFSGTLDALPDTCWITLQLKYYESAPADYEPEYFRASTGTLTAAAESLPLVINIGNIHTPCVDMKLKYAGLESLLFEDLCKISSRGDEVSVAPSKAPSEPSVLRATNCALSKELQNMAVASPYTTQNSPPSSPVATALTAPVTTAVPAPTKTAPKKPSVADRVIEHLRNGGSASLPHCAKALALPAKELKSTFDQLVQDGILKRKGKGYNFDVAAAPAPVGAATSAAPVLMTPQDSPGNSCAETSVSTASRLAHAPPAPRKSAAAKPPAAPAEEMTDDIEDTYQEPAAVTAARTVTPATTALRQPALQLQGKKSGTEDQENQATNNQSSGKKRRAQEMTMQEAISMSQESVLSEVSAGGTHRKRARKCSVVRDPIHLHDLHGLARRNRQTRAVQ